ncbi:MAG: AI-2E family transporter [Candidatus Pacebacteria bacterium]|nr:AI-2E family transporter [Candidatus Paceibacterota bacterium]
MKGMTAQHYFLLALLAGAAWVAFLVVKPFFSALALGAVFAVVLQPVYRRIRSYVRGKESLAALSTVGVSIIIVLIPIIFVSLQLLKEAQALYGSLNDTDTQRVFSQWVTANGAKVDTYVPNASQSLREISASFDDYARAAASWIVLNIGAAFSSIASLFLNLFIFFVTLYYLLRDGGRLKRYLIELSPLNDSDDEHIVHKLEVAVNSVVKGKLAIAVIQGVLAGIGLAIFGVPNPVVWGLVAIVVSLIPPIGTALVLFPAIMYLVIAGELPSAGGLTLWAVGVSVIDNVIGPRLIGDGMQIHPLLVLLSVLGGLALFGPVGLFLGPLSIALLLALLSLHTIIAPESSKKTLPPVS